jgi:hypothetical protein
MNPFHYRTADTRYGIPSDLSNFIELFSSKSLNIFDNCKTVFENIPLLLVSSPGGGKTSIMRVFSYESLNYLCENNNKNKPLFNKLEELGCYKNSKPYLLGLRLIATKRYNDFFELDNKSKNGLFYAFFNSRVIILFIQAIFTIYGLRLDENKSNAKFRLKKTANDSARNAFNRFKASNVISLYNTMMEIEENLFDIVNDPFWDGVPSSYTDKEIWALNFIFSIDVIIEGKRIEYLPIVMIDDFHNFKSKARDIFLESLSSREFNFPFWLSSRKSALPLETYMSDELKTAVNKGRDYEVLDLNKNHKNFSAVLFDIFKLRISHIESKLSINVKGFNIFLKNNFNDKNFVVTDSTIDQLKKNLKEKYVQGLNHIDKIITTYIDHNLPNEKIAIYLAALDIYLYRKIGEDTIFYQNKNRISLQEFNKFISRHQNYNASKLFLGKKLRLPYYCGIRNIISITSNSIDQFLSIFGRFYDELSVNFFIKGNEWEPLSFERQNDLINKLAFEYLNRIPKEIPYGKYISPFIRKLLGFCHNETYKNNAPYAPGVTGIALLSDEFGALKKCTTRKYIHLYKIIKNAISHNLLEPNYITRQNKTLIVLYVNRLLCCTATWHLPVQKGSYRILRLNYLIDLFCSDIVDDHNEEQLQLW